MSKTETTAPAAKKEAAKEPMKNAQEPIEHKNIYAALAAFQQEVEPLHKGSEGHGYSYADLSEVVTKINPIMKKHGLGFTQPITNGVIKTVIFHTPTGEKIESENSLYFDELVYVTVEKKDKDGNPYEKDIIAGFEGMNRAQAMGSMITYFRRYFLGAALGIVTEKDTDGTGAKSEDFKKSDRVKVDHWMSEKQLMQALENPEKAAKSLAWYDNKTAQEDGKVYGMKKDYRDKIKAVAK